MSQQHADLWKTVAAAWTERLDAVSDDQWQASSTCADWDVQALVNHTVETQAQFAGGMVGAEIAEGAAWPEIHQAISAKLEDPSMLGEMTEMPGMGEVPKAMLFGIAISDMLVHTWDLARTIGADEQLPADAVAIAFEGLKRFPPQMMRADGRFGAEVACADDADLQTQMLSFAGRQV